MTHMPVGTIGFEAVGEVEDEAVEPVLREEMPAGASCACCTRSALRT
jgi:hypothetical protein